MMKQRKLFNKGKDRETTRRRAFVAGDWYDKHGPSIWNNGMRENLDTNVTGLAASEE